ncbi:MAG TPA: glycosyltransferase family 2 protein [Kiritimatiellia bacterium]|nr:glycosyltransferase family 2 protein [Kiritimatiellia bacterium]
MTTPSSSLGITVAVMNYNEAPSLERVVTEIREELERMGNPHEVVIIEDGSTDGSREIAERLSREHASVRVLQHPVNLGLGAVYHDGFFCGEKDLVTLFPADGQFEPSIIPQFVRLFDHADLVLGVIPEYNKSRSAFARFLSWGERLIYKILFGGFPEFQGIMMLRRSLLDSIQLTSTGRGWTIQMEVILRFRDKGYRIVNEPTTIRPRMSGESKVSNLKAILSNLRQVFALRLQLWRGK